MRPSSCAASRASAVWRTISAARRGLEPAVALDLVGQVEAGDEPHVDVETAVDGAEVVDRDDVRRREAGGGARLAPEALLVVAVVGEPAVQALDGDGALAGGVERAVHLAHPAAPDALLETVGPEHLHRVAGGRRGRVARGLGAHGALSCVGESRETIPLDESHREYVRSPPDRPVASHFSQSFLTRRENRARPAKALAPGRGARQAGTCAAGRRRIAGNMRCDPSSVRVTMSKL